MSTFKLPDTDVEVKLAEGLTKEELLNFPAFKNWHTRLTSSLALQHTNKSHPFHTFPYALNSITIQSFTKFSASKIGFLNLNASITNSNNEYLSGSIFLRGPSVGMLVILTPDDLEGDARDGEKWVIMTVQPRIAAGSVEFVELPAGMVDGGSFGGAAAREIYEEVGLKIEESELINLSELAGQSQQRSDEGLPNAMFPSAGGCDEFIPLFLCEKKVLREELDSWTGRLTGLRDEGEKITLKLVKLENLWREGARDAKALGAWALYDGLRRSGKL
ncbi:related to nucleoside diphosphate-sugar hydrolase of the MutT (NUDIX) family [Phialocephala subalpina]|uniref:Related to nucleoside diphosphate-sugar hydrolase of the MutT (NUDIX) family n=1 Tax=Phialocephala subalpina TaxID=576137 RepID=A0A1L7XCZ5_9HELO|nr:related to nucleoside diphosphate-sugar hydrolase of the MutT (NUDIX) family [Phialocephala subalpina]